MSERTEAGRAATWPPGGGALILAAGRSRRFGGDKRLAEYRGRPLVALTVSRYAEVFANLLILIRPEDESVRAALSEVALTPSQRIGYAPRAEGGMGYTLADGVAQVAGWRFAFVALADMPFVTHTTLCYLRDTYQRQDIENTSIVQPVYDGTPGHPVAFPNALFGALTQLQGDQGAKTVVQVNQQRLLRVPVHDRGVIQDVDRSADLPR